MRILADSNIPLLEAFFAEIGTVTAMPGREMTAAAVKDADILLVRSVTRVDAELLEGSRVRFVGSATIGTDHVDLEWLRKQNIGFASAPGSNANSVVDYVLSVLSVFSERRGIENWTDLSVGIVGAGNVGGRLGSRLERLGFRVRVCDPPLEQKGELDGAGSLDEVLESDVVTVHTPLVHGGSDPTFHLIGASELEKLGPDQLLINTSRGPVVDCEALRTRLSREDAPVACLDVWEGEPDVDPDLASLCWLLTPHIAGYSQDGKMQGTEMIYQAVCHHLGLPVRKKAGQFMSDPPLSKMAFTGSVSSHEAARIAIRACYDVRCDDARYRQVIRGPAGQRATGFDQLRAHYPIRRDFSSVKIQLKAGAKDLQQDFKALGFKLKS